MTDINSKVEEVKNDAATPVATDAVIDTTAPAAENKAAEATSETKSEEVKKA